MISKPTRQPAPTSSSPAAERRPCMRRGHRDGELRGRGHKPGQRAGRPLAGMQQQLRERLAGAPPDLRCAARVPQRGLAVLCCGHAEYSDLQYLQVCRHAHRAAGLPSLLLLWHTRTCTAGSPFPCTSLCNHYRHRHTHHHTRTCTPKYKGVHKLTVEEACHICRHDKCDRHAHMLTPSRMLQRGGMQQRPVGVWPLRQLQRAVQRGNCITRSHLQGREWPRPSAGGRVQRHTADAAPAAPMQPSPMSTACLGSRGLGLL